VGNPEALESEMTPVFSISQDWISSDVGPEEVRHTAGSLRITVGEHIATRIEDLWSKSVRDDVNLSAYPLALWFAGSWFRLRWEPSPNERPSLGWRMAHKMPAAGHGYIWPPLTFVSDGETVKVTCRATRPTASEPIRYLEQFVEHVPASAFERAIDQFIELVLARLEGVGIRETQLQSLWPEVMGERMNPDAAHYRRLEARLGFDPDEGPSGTMDRLVNLALKAGEAASEEIAPACSGANPNNAIEQVLKLADSKGIDVSIQSPLKPALLPPPNGHIRPWKRGYLLALNARAAWNIDTDRVDDQKLSEILDADIARAQVSYPQAPLGLAVRNGDPNRLMLLPRRRELLSRRFEAARFLAETLNAPATDHWLPATDSKTARQEVQRNFAAEFLCPIGELEPLFRGNFYDEVAIEKAAQHFKVDERVVISQLANHGFRRRF
jgi:hypothetical protein